MRSNRDAFNVGREHERIVCAKMRLARRDVDAREEPEQDRKLQVHERARRRAIREVETDAPALGLQLATRMEVELQDQIGASRERQGDAIGVGVRLLPHGPAAERRVVQTAAHALIAWFGVGVIGPAGRAGGVAEVEDVVDHRSRCRPEIDGADPPVFLQAERDHEVPIDVGAVRRDGPGDGQLDDQVRRPELPT